MKSRYLKFTLMAASVSLFYAGCGDNSVVGEDQNLSMVSSLDPDDCNNKSEGSMAFVKSTATMYVCSDGEWIAMNDQEAVN